MSHYAAPGASGPLRAELSLPGSKSLTNRELVLSALADAPSRLRRPLIARDTELMVDALTALGAVIESVPSEDGDGRDWLVHPAPLRGDGRVDCGLAGTVMRFVPPIAALVDGTTTFDGDEAARVRPMSTTVTALRDLGVLVDDGGTGALPFSVRGTGSVRGGELVIDASGSSQFVSGLLLSAPHFERGLVLRHQGERLPSEPHISMTAVALAERGVQIFQPEDGVWIVPPTPIAGRTVDIEPDLSNAAPFLAAALVAGGSVSVTGWPDSTTQVGDELRRLLPAFGATVTRDGDTVTVDGGAGVRSGQPLRAVDLDLSIGGELAPTIVGLAALADGPSRITGIGHLRGHETDRLAALADDIRRLGGEVTELDDGLEIQPRWLHGGVWGCFGDHRMATTGALLGLVVPGVELDDVGTTAKTLPEFPELWASMLAQGTDD